MSNVLSISAVRKNALTEGVAILQRGDLRKVLRRSLHCQRYPVAHRADVEVKYLLNLFQLLMTIQDLDQIVLRLSKKILVFRP